MNVCICWALLSPYEASIHLTYRLAEKTKLGWEVSPDTNIKLSNVRGFGLCSKSMGRNPLDQRYGQCTLPGEITEIFRSIMLLVSSTVMTPIFTVASFGFHRRFFQISPTLLLDFTDGSFGFHRGYFSKSVNIYSGVSHIHTTERPSGCYLPINIYPWTDVLLSWGEGGKEQSLSLAKERLMTESVLSSCFQRAEQ